jgi:hypothetical protein
MKKRILFFCCFIIPFLTGAHPLKMAYTAVKYNTEKQLFEIGHRVFQDDFEAALISIYNYSGKDVFQNQEQIATKKVINAFFDDSFSFIINGKKLQAKLSYIEQKYDMGIIVWYETEAVKATDIKKIMIYNSIMMESFKEQVNMFNIAIGSGYKRTLKFDYKTRKETIIYRNEV